MALRGWHAGSDRATGQASEPGVEGKFYYAYCCVDAEAIDHAISHAQEATGHLRIPGGAAGQDAVVAAGQNAELAPGTAHPMFLGRRVSCHIRFAGTYSNLTALPDQL